MFENQIVTVYSTKTRIKTSSIWFYKLGHLYSHGIFH